jgi:hypothetical protein
MRPNPPDQDVTEFQEARVALIISALKQGFARGANITDTIQALCEHNDCNGALWRQCVEDGAIELFVAILKRHITVAAICKHAAQGLTLMLTSPHPDLITPNYPDVDRATTSGAIPLLLDVLDRHYDNIEVCIQTCAALRPIALLAGPACVQIIPLIFDLVERNHDNTTLMSHVTYLLNNISKTCYLTEADSKTLILSLLTILENHPHNTVICPPAVSALARFISTNQAFVLAHKVRTRKLLLRVQNNHPYGKIKSLHKALHSLAKKPTRRHRHPLYATANPNHVCDICKASAEDFMCCSQCDYDECMLCFNSVTA